MKLHLIYARSANGVIGKAGGLPWKLPEDLAHFKRCTMRSPVIMGRKTWDSLPARFRPLPERSNVVVTRQRDWQAPRAHVAHSLAQALELCADAPEAWIIGGAELYAQALPLASKAVVTEIEADFDGDTFAPQFSPHWKPTQRERHVSATGLHFSFVTYINTLKEQQE